MKKPFNLEAALTGSPVVTQSGEPVKILASGLRSLDIGSFIIVSITREKYDDIRYYSPEGFNLHNEEACLYMAPKTKQVWINLYPNGNFNIHPTKKEADCRAGHGRVECRCLEWEVD